MACLKELILSSCKIKHCLCIVIQDPVTLLGYVDQVTEQNSYANVAGIWRVLRVMAV